MSAELVCAAGGDDWLTARRLGITATDIVTIAGLVTWDSPWALYHRKLGLLPEVEQSDRMRLGSWLEHAIKMRWAEVHREAVGQSFLYRNTARIWQLATPDGHVYDGEPLECKTSATRDGWGPDGSDVVPAHVRAQVLWQMDTLEVGVGHVAVVFLPSGEFRSYTIRHALGSPACQTDNCGFCTELDGLRDLGFGFWSRILRRDPPPLDGLEVTTDALRHLHPAPGGQVDIDPAAVTDYDHAQQQKLTWTNVARCEQSKIRDLMGDAHEATVDGQVVFRRTISGDLERISKGVPGV